MLLWRWALASTGRPVEYRRKVKQTIPRIVSRIVARASEVSRAEHDRLRSSLQLSLQRVSEDFSAEISSASSALVYTDRNLGCQNGKSAKTENHLLGRLDSHSKGVKMCFLLRTTGFLLFTLAAFAQSDRGTITGTVTDPVNAVIPSATVTAKNTETGAQYATVSTSTGNYTLSQLPAGVYDLGVEVAGFNKFVRQGIRVFVGGTERVDVTLQVGGTTESVTVTADASLLKTENAEQSTTIGVEKLNELPLNFGANGNSASGNVRNPITFVTLVPSASMNSYQGNAGIGIRLNGSVSNTFQIRVEGQQANNNRLMIRQDQLMPSVEALEEVSVQTSNYSAEYGQVAGGMFNFTTKSGTNRFHGSLFEYFVNEDLGAGIPYTDSGHGHLLRPPNRRDDAGGSFGGPVWIPKIYNGRNKTFFFWTFEEFYQNQVVAGVLQTMPTTAMRNGDFSGALTGKTLGTDPLGRPILENTIYDPNTNQTVNGQVVRNPFPNNVIPSSRFDPVALKIQALIPAPTYPGVLNNWNQAFSALTTETIPSIKVDQNFSNQGKLSFYYSRYHGPHFNGSDGLPIPITKVRWIDTLSWTTRLNYDQPVTPTLLIHAGVGFIHHPSPDQSIPEVRSYDPVAGLGLKGALFGLGFPGISGLSSATGGGMTLGMGASGGPIILGKPTAVLSATLVRGNHTYKLGADVRIDALTQPSFTAEFGSYAFNSAQTSLPYLQGQTVGGGNVGLPYASFLLGLVNTASIGNPTSPQTRKPSWSLFLQDNWKVTHKLTLDYGVRWDYQGYGDEIHQRTSEFSATTPNPSAGGLPGATIYEGNAAGACKCSFTQSYPYAIGPRIGVAYQALPKTVLRAGWGLTYQETAYGQSNIISNLGAGGWNTLNFTNPTFGAQALNLKDGLSYNVADLYAQTYNAGIRPSPGQLDSPPPLIDRNAGRPGRINQWNISLQREITGDLVLETSYVGNRGAWLLRGQPISPSLSDSYVNINAITPQRLVADGLDINNAADRTLLTSTLGSAAVQARGFKAPYAGYPTSATLAQSLRPFPQFGAITLNSAPLGNSWYDALQVKLTKRVSHGLDLLGSFVWQKELDNNEGYTSNVFDRSIQKTLSSFSQPLVFVVAFNYRLPQLGSNRWMRLALGDWTISGNMKYASGIPIPVPIAQNNLNSLLFITNTGPVGTGATYANRVAGQPLFLKDLNCHCIDPNKDFVLNPNAWTQPAAGQFGVSAPFYGDYRYARAPSEQMSLGRIFRIREGMSLRIRAEFFNVFNRTYQSQPVSTNSQQTQTHNALGLASGGFGFVTPGAVLFPSRNGQIVARFEF
jgi:Carboxypeptidase regulatory-like domain/TonB dependent receptor